jgi:hypothetical protein
MLRSSASLMAEDVTVRCRVRKQTSSTNTTTKTHRTTAKAAIQNDEPMIEMTCTMRNWENGCVQHQRNRDSSNGRSRLSLRNAFSLSNPEIRTNMNTSNSKLFNSDTAVVSNTDSCTETTDIVGPELLFTPTYDMSPSKSQRFGGNGTINNCRRVSPLSLQPYSIPVDEILLVTYDIAGSHNTSKTGSSASIPNCNTKIHLTTLSLGCYDIDCITTNGHDIVLAFLQASLLPERIVKDTSSTTAKSPRSRRSKSTHHRHRHPYDTNGENDEVPSVRSAGSSSVTSSCLDIDALQAKHLAGRAEAETWYEKFHRRLGHIVSNVSEQFSNGSFCDACCNHSRTASTTDHPTESNSMANNVDGQNRSNVASSNRTSTNVHKKMHSSFTTGANTSPKSMTSNTVKPSFTKKGSSALSITGCFYNELEIDDSATDCSPRTAQEQSSSPVQRRQQQLPIPSKSSIPPHLPKSVSSSTIGSRHNSTNQQQLQSNRRLKQHIAHMPSGLSVEPDPYDVESVR